ncbi:hypothetical protein SSPIM334S_07633 [Streptomyces spiroverticillatus]
MPARVPRPEGALRGWGTSWAASPEWVVDHLLRNAGIYTCPPPRPDSALYVSLHGGIAANIGYLETTSGGWGEWYKAGAPFECAAEGGWGTPYQATYVPESMPLFGRTAGLWFEFWAVNKPPHGDSTVEIQSSWSLVEGRFNYLTLTANFTKGTLTASCGADPDPTKNPSLTWTWASMSTVDRPMHVGWWVRSAARLTITPVVTLGSGDPFTFNDGFLDAPTMTHSAVTKVRFGLNNAHAECFQMSTPPTRPTTTAEITQRGTWQRTAALTRPAFALRTLPAVKGSAWDVITEIARATLSTAEFLPNGQFRWNSYARWATTPATAGVTVTSARELGSLTLTEEIDACRNAVTVTVADWSSVRASGLENLTDSPAVTAIGAGTTLVRTIPIQETAADPRTPQCLQTGAPVTTPDRVIIRAGAAATTDLDPRSVETSMRREGGLLTLSLRNRGTATVYYHGAILSTIKADREPAPYRASAVHADSQRAYGVQEYEHDVRGWVQTLTAAQTLANALRDAGAYPIPLLQSVEILPDPRIELGDVVRVRDTTGAQLDTLAWVIGIKASGSSGRITQTLTLRGTKANGAPTDTGLSPDPPVDPTAAPPA